MRKFLRRGATFILGATSVPESRVGNVRLPAEYSMSQTTLLIYILSAYHKTAIMFDISHHICYLTLIVMSYKSKKNAQLQLRLWAFFKRHNELGNGVKLTQLLSIFTSKKGRNLLIKIQLTNSYPKRTRGWKVPSLMPIGVKLPLITLGFGEQNLLVVRQQAYHPRARGGLQHIASFVLLLLPIHTI